MNKKIILRLISLIILIIAIIFVFSALSNPALGKVIYIGDFKFGAEQWRTCYLLYLIIMAGLFISSFFKKKP